MMIDIKVQYGYNNDGMKLVHVTPTGLISEPYPQSFFYHPDDGTIGWLDKLTFDPSFSLPKKVMKFIKKGPFILCVLGFMSGYAELVVGDTIAWNWCL